MGGWVYSQAPSLVRASCKARLDQVDWVWGIVQLEVKEGPLRGRWDLELVGLGWVAVGAGVWGVGFGLGWGGGVGSLLWSAHSSWQ